MFGTQLGAQGVKGQTHDKGQVCSHYYEVTELIGYSEVSIGLVRLPSRMELEEDRQARGRMGRKEKSECACTRERRERNGEREREREREREGGGNFNEKN